MSIQYLIPGGQFVNEDPNGESFLLPGGGFIGGEVSFPGGVVGTVVTIGSGLRPRLQWAEGLTGVIVADRRHPSLARYDAGLEPTASPKGDDTTFAKTVVVKVARPVGDGLTRYHFLTLPPGVLS